MTADGDEYEVWRNHNMQHAQELLCDLGQRGLRFKAFLPGDLAHWLLTTVSAGHFTHPNEMIVEMAKVYRILELHPDLKQELLERHINQVRADKAPRTSNESLSEGIDQLGAIQAPEPLEWKS